MRFPISFFRMVSSIWPKEKGSGLALYRLKRTVRKYHSCYTIPIGGGGENYQPYLLEADI